MPVVVLSRDCPGYAEATRREEVLRAVPFLGLDERIAGLAAAPLTLRKVQWLTLTKSPFLSSLKTEVLLTKPDIAGDIVLFLWIVSPQFEAGNEKAKRRFYKASCGVMAMDAAKVIQEILEYVEEAFLDEGESSGQESRSYYSTAAGMVGFFSKNYGLQIDVWEISFWRNLVRKIMGQPNVLDIPLRIAFQLIRVHKRQENPNQVFNNRLSQPKVDDWMRGLNRN